MADGRTFAASRGTTLAEDELIALNASPDLGRDQVCRLALAPRPWTRFDKAVVEKAKTALAGTTTTAAGERSRAADLGAVILTLGSEGYPDDLLDLELPPPVLYCRGRLPDRPAIAVVGSRRADPYGLEVAESFATELAASGLTIVSGLARGVDTAAHRGALAAAGGRTVAVLGCGIDRHYPTGSGPLARRIAERGAVLSEFPCGFSPLPRNFPVRNRIIAALGIGTLVVRAAPRSGSLITARLALELGRDVYAVPGAIFDDRSLGTNALIRDGALVAASTRDILESLPWQVRERLADDDEAPPPPRSDPLPEGGERLLELLPQGATLTQDELVGRCGLPTAETLALLVELEIGGRVRRYPGPRFSRQS